MTKELIENIRTIIVPYMAHDLRRINYENMGEIDAEQFKEDMNEILDLATKALEQEPKTCKPNALVNMQIEGLRMYKRLINGLPDGYPMPIKK